MTVETVKIGKRGTVVLPARLRRRYGMDEGTFVLFEEGPTGVVVRPAAVYPVEVYTPERRAEFLLSNSMDAADYERNRREVRAMGLDPDAIRHVAPPGVRRRRRK